MSSTPASTAGWLATTPTDRPPRRAKPTTMLPREVGVDLEKPAVVHDARTITSCMSYGLFGFVGHERVQLRVRPRWRGRSSARAAAGSSQLRGQVAQQLADAQQQRALVREGAVAHARLGRVRVGAAQLLLRHLLVGDRLDHVRAGHEHVARAARHEREVGDGGGVDRAAGARPEHGRDLRDDAARERVLEKDVGVAAERRHALLDARAARVVEADDRRAVLHRELPSAGRSSRRAPARASRRRR